MSSIFYYIIIQYIILNNFLPSYDKMHLTFRR